jgi:hypothetical protein
MPVGLPASVRRSGAARLSARDPRNGKSSARGGHHNENEKALGLGAGGLLGVTLAVRARAQLTLIDAAGAPALRRG